MSQDMCRFALKCENCEFCEKSQKLQNTEIQENSSPRVEFFCKNCGFSVKPQNTEKQENTSPWKESTIFVKIANFAKNSKTRWTLKSKKTLVPEKSSDFNAFCENWEFYNDCKIFAHSLANFYCQ